MTYYNPKIPEKNGEFLCIPSLNLIPQLIKSNKEKFKTYNFTIGYEGFHEFRKRLREKVILLSEKFTANLGIKSHLYNNADTIVQTGHQPIFYHPGIIIKNLILNKIGMMEGINAINLIVDTDNFKEIAVNILDYRDGIKIEKEILLSNQYPIPFEFSTPPSQEEFNLFIKGIKNHLSHPQFKNLHAHFNRYISNISDTQKNYKTLSEFMTAIRRIYEGEIESEYLEIPLSYICDTNEFLIFFISIAMKSEKFTSIYNCQLERYRKEHKLRYPVNPFPNLTVDGEKTELPFWHFYENKRGRVFAKSKNDTVVVSFEGGDSIEFNRKKLYNGIDLIKKDNIKIRPKAMILTLFNRMFVSDAFIHGVGGAKYDRITDNIIRDFYNIEPPQFITASLTLYPDIIKGQDKQPPQSPLTKGELQENIKKLEKKLRDMKYNPERYEATLKGSPAKDEGQGGSLAEEKEYLISLLKNNLANKSEISRKIKEINEKIYQKIKPLTKDIEDELNILKRQHEQLEIIQRRDYPYFLFSPCDIMKIISSMSQHGK
ncbi:MAG: hypothetical protein HY096_06205 [Nitrospinae bacterium]|nr:hypothetical protein [Nitrospinota bacterium]